MINKDLVQTHELLQRASQNGQTVELTVDDNGQRRTVQLSPELTRSLQTGLNAEFLGLTDQVNNSMRIDADQAGTLLGVPQSRIPEMTSQYRQPQDDESTYSANELIQAAGEQMRIAQGA